MKTKILSALITIFLLLLIVGTSIFLLPLEQEAVRISYLPISASLPLFVAIENNYFSEEDIEIETIELQNAKQAIDSIIAGRTDVVISIPNTETLSAESRSPNTLKIFTLSALSKNSHFEGILVKKDSEIKTINDLKDKKIGVFPGLTAKTFLKTYLKKKKIDTESIKYISLTSSNQIGALSSGSIDALFAYEPIKTIALTKGLAIEIQDSVFGQVQDPLYLASSSFSQKFLNENPETAKKVKKVLEKSIIWMRENPQEAKLILPKYTSMTEEIALKSPYLPEIGTIKESDIEQFQKFVDLLNELGLINSRIGIETILYRN